MKIKLMLCALYLGLSGCCGLEEFLAGEEEACADQIFTETRKLPFITTYEVNEDKIFLLANKITASQIRSALSLPSDPYTLKSLQVTSAKVNYSRAADNTAAAMFLNLGVISGDGTFDLLLLKERNVLLPLFDIPATPFSNAVKLNEYLNGKAISELNKAMSRYVTSTNLQDDLSFIMTGEPSPKGLKMHFTLEFNLEVTVVYEVCKYAPLGVGERICE
ncbi:MAG: hypothetical protein IPM34_05685 [Saprospiraceae bacterium]|nr:hypothetical protein [Saprospiraceae bacterium]